MELTWEPGPRRWRKIYKGGPIRSRARSSACPEKSCSRTGPQRLVGGEEAGIDARAPEHPLHRIIEELRRRREWAAQFGDHEALARLDRTIDEAPHRPA